MTSVRIRLVQSVLRDGDVAGNLAKALDIIAAACGNTDLVVFSETYTCGFPTPDDVAQLAEPIDGPTVTAMRNAAREAHVAVVFGFAERDGDSGSARFFNTALLIDETGLVQMRYRKTHLYESDAGVFEPGDAYPVCEWRGVKVGLLICFDLEFPETARALARAGAELIVIPDGMMNPYGAVHARAIPVRAQENQVYVVMANRVGAGDRYTFSGGSVAAAPDGARIAMASDTDEACVDVALDLQAVAEARAAFCYLDLVNANAARLSMRPAS